MARFEIRCEKQVTRKPYTVLVEAETLRQATEIAARSHIVVKEAEETADPFDRQMMPFWKWFVRFAIFVPAAFVLFGAWIYFFGEQE